MYYCDEEYRQKKIKESLDYFKSLPLEKRKILYQKRKGYIGTYIRERYRNDKAFRNKMKKRAIKNYYRVKKLKK